jgi:hypothetical protein
MRFSSEQRTDLSFLLFLTTFHCWVFLLLALFLRTFEKCIYNAYPHSKSLELTFVTWPWQELYNLRDQYLVELLVHLLELSVADIYQ